MNQIIFRLPRILIQLRYTLLQIGLFSILLTACDVNNEAEAISVDQLQQRIETGNAPVILDVRTNKEYDKGHIQGAMHIPLKQLPDRLDELSTFKINEVVVYCYSGKRADKAIKILKGSGFNRVIDLTGHYQDWVKQELPIANN